MKPTAEQIKAIALIVDGEAWKAIEDGRDALPGSLWGFRRDIAMEKAMAIAALPFLPIAVEGKVKQLEWRESLTSDGREQWHSNDIETITVMGRSYGKCERYWLFHARKGFATLDAAKAAAQSDYETRILSALISPPPGKDGWQEVEAVKYEARICKGVPADCCDYGVVDLEEGIEVCRVWKEADARLIADLLNGTVWPEPTEDGDDLTECFRHHVRTAIGWQAFGARPGPEMQMYEEGFKAGYRRCQSDNEPEFGEEEDALDARARKVIGRLRDSLKAGGVEQIDIDNAVDLIIDQAKALTRPQPASTALVERLKERGQAFANQVRLITHLLHGQAYSTTVAELNAFDAALSASTSREGER